MSNITIKNEGFSLAPKNFEEAVKFAEIMAKSQMVPKNYQNKPNDILVAVAMGAELGLQPIQSLQNIAVINGNPSIYGDAALALVKAHPQFEDIQETIEQGVAVCKIKRKGQSWHVASFSTDDAKKAGLWGKAGPWSQYPSRMLQMRARGFGIRNTFPDALKGLITAEEAQDYPVESRDITPAPEFEVQSSAYKSPTEILSSKLDEALNEDVNEHQESENVHNVKSFDDLSSRTIMFTIVNDLIIKYQIKDDVVSAWLKKANVNRLEDMNEETLDKIRIFIEQKYISK